MRYFSTLLILCLLFSCSKSGDSNTNPTPTPTPAALYFPPLSGSTWETSTAASLGWNESLFTDLYTYLQQKNTKAFIILKNGKIVAEKYFGNFTADSNWYWASAGKTATAMLVGIAQ